MLFFFLQLLYDSSTLFVIYNSTKIQVTKRKNGTYYIHTSDFIISDPVHWYGEGCCSSCRVSVRAICFCVGSAQGNDSAHVSNGLSGCMQPSADFVTLTVSVTAVACGPLTYKNNMQSHLTFNVINILGTLLHDSVSWTEKLDVMKTMWWLQNGQECFH